MNVNRPIPSIAAAGPPLGRLIEKHMDYAFRAMMHGPETERTDRFVRLITGEPHPFGNFAFVSDPDDVQNTALAIEPFCAATVPTAALYPGAPAPEVEEYLRQNGFTLHERMPAMAVDIDKLTSAPIPKGYQLRRVEDTEEVREWAQAFALGFELPSRVAEVFSPVGGIGTDDDAPLRCFAITRGRRIVSTSMLYLYHGIAGVYCVSTIPEERGKGLAAHATAEPLRRMISIGYRVGVLQSTTAGYKVYRRLGFTDFGAVPLYVRGPH